LVGASSLTLLGMSALGSLQAFASNVSPQGDHRIGSFEDFTPSVSVAAPRYWARCSLWAQAAHRRRWLHREAL